MSHSHKMIHEENTERIIAEMFLDNVKHFLILHILDLKKPQYESSSNAK